MPRGIYDRTTTKAPKTVEKTKITAPKRKSTRKLVQSETTLEQALSALNSFAYEPDAFVLMSEARANLSVLAQIAQKFENMSSVEAEIEAHVAILGILSKKVFQEILKSFEPTLVKGESSDNTYENESTNGVVPLPVVSSGVGITAR